MAHLRRDLGVAAVNIVSISTVLLFIGGRHSAEDNPGRRSTLVIRGVTRDSSAIFLFVHQFNEYIPSDEGWDAEPTATSNPRTYGAGALDEVRMQIQPYRHNGPAE